MCKNNKREGDGHGRRQFFEDGYYDIRTSLNPCWNVVKSGGCVKSLEQIKQRLSLLPRSLDLLRTSQKVLTQSDQFKSPPGPGEAARRPGRSLAARGAQTPSGLARPQRARPRFPFLDAPSGSQPNPAWPMAAHDLGRWQPIGIVRALGSDGMCVCLCFFL